MEGDNGGEPCFSGWEPLVRREAGGRFIDEVSALSLRHDSLPPHRASFHPSASLHPADGPPLRFADPAFCSSASLFPSDSPRLFVWPHSIFSPCLKRPCERGRSVSQCVPPLFLPRTWLPTSLETWKYGATDERGNKT